MTNENDLIARSRRGDTKAFETLVLKYKDRLYAIASSVCAKMPSEAPDVAQETFISALKHINSFRGNAAFGTWLYRIAANNCWQRLRKAKTEAASEIPGDKSRGHPAAPSAGESVIKNELTRAVSKALMSLPPDYRIVITLCDIEGLSNSETAGKLKISLSAMKAKLHRARLRLREQLKDFR